MSAKKCVTCPLMEDYRFIGRCKIKTCKNVTSLTKHGCIAIDHVFPGGDKNISDAELMVYKFEGDAASVRNVGAKRKRATSYVKQYILFYYFVQYLRTKYPEPTMFYYREGIEPLLDRVLAMRPMKRERLQLHPWLLPHIINPELQKAFKLDHGSSDTLDLVTLFDLKPKEFEKVCASIEHMRTTNSLF